MLGLLLGYSIPCPSLCTTLCDADIDSVFPCFSLWYCTLLLPSFQLMILETHASMRFTLSQGRTGLQSPVKRLDYSNTVRDTICDQARTEGLECILEAMLRLAHASPSASPASSVLPTKVCSFMDSVAISSVRHHEQKSNPQKTAHLQSMQKCIHHDCSQ